MVGNNVSAMPQIRNKHTSYVKVWNIVRDFTDVERVGI